MLHCIGGLSECLPDLYQGLEAICSNRAIACQGRQNCPASQKRLVVPSELVGEKRDDSAREPLFIPDPLQELPFRRSSHLLGKARILEEKRLHIPHIPTTAIYQKDLLLSLLDSQTCRNILIMTFILQMVNEGFCKCHRSQNIPIWNIYQAPIE